MTAADWSFLQANRAARLPPPHARPPDQLTQVMTMLNLEMWVGPTRRNNQCRPGVAMWPQ